MAWQDDMVRMLRVFVADQAGTTYTDAILEETLLVSAFQVALECDFSQDFDVSLSQDTIDPDPTDEDTRDDSFVNLVCMKAACVIDQGSALTAVKQAIAVKDGPSSIDLRGPMQGRLALLEKGWCATYEESRMEYQAGQVRVAGAMVLTPFRLNPRDTYDSHGNQRSLYPL